jgi:hypothetical protein
MKEAGRRNLKPLEIHFLNNLLDDKGHPLLFWFLRLGYNQGISHYVDGLAKLRGYGYGEFREFSASEMDRIEAFQGPVDQPWPEALRDTSNIDPRSRP